MLKRLTRIYQKIGLDGVGFVVSALTGLGMAVYSIAGGGAINPSVLVGILSVLALEIVVQRIRVSDSRDEIIKSLKGVRLQSFSSGKDFADIKYKLLLDTEQYIYDTELCLPIQYARPPIAPPSKESKFREELHEIIKKGELTYKFVQVIYDKPHFESLLKRLFAFGSYHYYLGYFVGAPEVIPVFNLMIFDDKHYLLGGYYGPSARGEDRNLYIQNEEIGVTLRQYFNHLWGKARLFNESRVINWDEIRYCGLKLGYSIDELNSLVKKISEEVGYKDVQTL